MKMGDDDAWYDEPEDRTLGYGSISQLTVHAARKVPTPEPIGFRVIRKERDQTMPDYDIFGEVHAELERASVWPPFHSAHEGYAVLAEEFDELWAHVKMNQKKRVLADMRAEAIQVAAMAIKFVEMIDAGRGRV